MRALVSMAQDADIVHTHLVSADIAGRSAGLVARKPIFCTLHSTWYGPSSMSMLPPLARLKAQAIRACDAGTARGVNQFFAVSATVRDTYARALHVRPERIDLLPNAVDLKEFDPVAFSNREDARAGIGLAPHEFGIVVVGRLVDQKDHATAIRAVAGLARARSVRLLVAGSGPREGSLRTLSSELQAPVSFLGVVDDVPLLLYASDLFLYPTFFEGMSVALMEAMAMGMPCVCSDIPENREVAEDAAVYVEPGNAIQLIVALQSLLEDDVARDRLGARAHALSARFDAHRVADQLVGAFFRALDGTAA
jgi:glycosyltransferase involved in cell wall biosynthesis